MSALLGIASLLGLLVGIIGVVVCQIKKKSAKKSLIILATSFIIFLVAVNIPGDAVTPTAVVPATSTEVAVEPVKEVAAPVVEKSVFKINEVVKTSSGATITISNLKISHGSEYDAPKSGMEFVMVTVTIKNTGTGNISYNPYDYKMQNSKGQITDGAFAMVNQDTALASGDLAEGGTITGTLIYEEPIKDAKLTLIYTGNMFTTEGVKFNLNY